MKRSEFFKNAGILALMAIPAGVQALAKKEEPTLIASNVISMHLPDGSQYYVVGVNKDKVEEIPYKEDKIEMKHFKKFKIKDYE